MDTNVYYRNNDVSVITDLHKLVPISINCNASLHSSLIMMGNFQSNIYCRKNCLIKDVMVSKGFTTVFEKIQRENVMVLGRQNYQGFSQSLLCM